MGHPISHSTKSGFNLRCSGEHSGPHVKLSGPGRREGKLSAWFANCRPWSTSLAVWLLSWEVGVPHASASPGSVGRSVPPEPLPSRWYPPPRPSTDLGVGQFSVAPVRLSVAPGWFPALSASSALGLGQRSASSWRSGPPAPRSSLRELGPPPNWPGVGHSCAARLSGVPIGRPFSACSRCLRRNSSGSSPCCQGVGVGHWRTAPFRESVSLGWSLAAFPSRVTGVGQDEDPAPLVGQPELSRAETTPLRIEPEYGQVSEDGSEAPSRNKSRDVLQKDPSGSNLPKAADEVSPDPPLVLGAAALSGLAPRLAREAGRDEIHLSAVSLAREGLEIVPNRRRIQGLLLHAGHESGRGEGLPLTVAHNSVSSAQGESETELQSPDSGAECEPSPGT